MRKTGNRMADDATAAGYQTGWRDAHESLTPRMAEMEDRIEELEAALAIIALRLPDQTLSEPIDWHEVSNTFVSVARNALDGNK